MVERQSNCVDLLHGIFAVRCAAREELGKLGVPPPVTLGSDESKSPAANGRDVAVSGFTDDARRVLFEGTQDTARADTIELLSRLLEACPEAASKLQSNGVTSAAIQARLVTAKAGSPEI